MGWTTGESRPAVGLSRRICVVPWVKWSEGEADLSPPSNAEIKNAIGPLAHAPS